MDLIQLSSSILNTLLYATSYVMSKYIYRIQKHKLSSTSQLVKQLRYQRRKLKIIIMGLPTLLCLIQNYINLCLKFSEFHECVKRFDTDKIGMGILTSFYMTLLLYIGPVYQEFWVLYLEYQNGNLRKKLGKIKFNKFRWDYFTKITPLIDELIFRELVNNATNFRYESNVVFILYSTFLYCGSKSISYRIKYNHFSIFEFMKSFVLGLYLSFVLVQTKTIVTVIINHGLMNFMGRPNFKDLFKGDYSSEQQWKMIRFYVLGFMAFLIFCILVL